MSGVKVTNERSSGPIPAIESVDGEVDGDNVDWEPGGAGTSELDQWKQPVRAATTANITIATALNAGDTIDGVTLVAGDRVLVKDQASALQNGIYVAGSSPARAADLDDDDEVLGAVVYVIAGTTNAGTTWSVTNTAATVVDTDAIDWAAFGTGGGGGGSGTTLPWFIVTDAAYGATGDGSTNDTAAINLAIAALNAAGRGVLYFPAGTYVTSGALTTITAEGTILGDGGLTTTSPGSMVTCTSATASLFTISANGCVIRDLLLYNTNGSAKTAGSGLAITGGVLVRLERLTVQGFYDGIDIENSAEWSAHAVLVGGAYRYGFRVRNTAVPDGGDWSIMGCVVSTASGTAGSAGIRIESSGGGKIANTKINGDSSRFENGIDVLYATGAQSTQLQLANVSVENVSSHGVKVVTTGTGKFGMVIINGLQVGLYSNNSGRAVYMNAGSTGGHTVNGGLGTCVIDGSVFHTDGTARAAIELVNTDKVTLGDIVYYGFNALYTSSGDTNTESAGEPLLAAHLADGTDAHDASAVSVADAGAYFAATDVEAALQELAADVAAGTTGGHYEVIVDGSAPPVAVTNVAEDDWLYGWVED